jgi:hypothetical protein
MAYLKLKEILPCYPMIGSVSSQPKVCNYSCRREAEQCNSSSSCNSNRLCRENKVKESYEARVTMPFNEWNNYVASGLNTLYAGAVVPGGTYGGSVYKGHVHQGY